MTFNPQTARVSKKYITIELTSKQYETLGKLAKEARMKPRMYAQLLFEAAFAARVGVQPSSSIDENVARAVLLWGCGEKDANIARKLGISKRTVNQIIDAWQNEVLGRAA